MENKKNNKKNKNNNSSYSLVFGRWPQTKMLIRLQIKFLFVCLNNAQFGANTNN